MTIHCFCQNHKKRIRQVNTNFMNGARKPQTLQSTSPTRQDITNLFEFADSTCNAKDVPRPLKLRFRWVSRYGRAYIATIRNARWQFPFHLLLETYLVTIVFAALFSGRLIQSLHFFEMARGRGHTIESEERHFAVHLKQ